MEHSPSGEVSHEISLEMERVNILEKNQTWRGT
jgi:hypothetical protein